jgi:hypothetical protein
MTTQEANTWPKKRYGKVEWTKRYEKASLLPALARQGGRVELTQKRSGRWTMKFESEERLPTSHVTARGYWFRLKGVSGEEQAAGKADIDLLLGGFEHIHPHVMIACCYDTEDSSDTKLTMSAWVWGIDDFFTKLLPSMASHMDDEVRSLQLREGATDSEILGSRVNDESAAVLIKAIRDLEKRIQDDIEADASSDTELDQQELSKLKERLAEAAPRSFAYDDCECAFKIEAKGKCEVIKFSDSRFEEPRNHNNGVIHVHE